ncbi:MAG: hypothetical protein I3273_02765 [Candidatus Moeniiplasma glomeromycotorum]|nr:hypothetical protein [Candidatus Moeniiplasma glomeromycotorum]MCE8167622.1 hypothetical protein [Candidatus Moeniiplasma glomeromycotorum]MCE8169027.1 hypothetical protein [Candidatus Moeniiplasma glomeromycotorum]
MKNEQNPYQQIAWIKVLNKQGFITCCQLISSMRYYILENQKSISEEEVKWFATFSYNFLYALQNKPMSESEKVIFCPKCLSFYQKISKKYEQ